MAYPASTTTTYNQQTKQYKEQQILTASPTELLLMLYDGAIRFCKLGKKGIHDKDFEKNNYYLQKAQHIIQEFMDSLDMELGGDIAKNLHSLYEYLNYRLVQANVKQDPAMVDEVLGHLENLRQTWRDAIKMATTEVEAAEKAETIPTAIPEGTSPAVVVTKSATPTPSPEEPPKRLASDISA